jgi:histidinol phosphatase-like enzyme
MYAQFFSGHLNYKNKPKLLIKLLKENKIVEKRTLYIGDKDDEPIAEILPEGNFIVSLYETDEFRQYMAKKYKSPTPESERDVELILFG